MKLTSAQASKVLRKLNEELKTLQVREENTKSFIASIEEDIESVRPDYDYASMQTEQKNIEFKIRKLKHALNVFNTTQIIPEYNITIDEMLVYLPQLTKQCSKLSSMKDALPKTRNNQGYYHNSSIIDYRYANYDPKQAEEDYFSLNNELAKAQTALDIVNNTVEFEVDI